MNQIQLKQIFPNVLTSGALFTVFKNNNLVMPYDKTEDIDTIELDVDYLSHSGEKLCSPLVKMLLSDDNTITNENLIKLAHLIYSKNIRNWNAIWHALTVDYDILHNYDGTETETFERRNTGTVSNQGNQTNTNTGTVTNSNSQSENDETYAFNSSTSVPTDKVTGTQTNTQTNNLSDSAQVSNTQTNNLTETETRTLTKGGNLGVTSSQQMIDQELELRKKNFYEILFKDIDNSVSLMIY